MTSDIRSMTHDVVSGRPVRGLTANAFLRVLPSALPGAHSVARYETCDATYCLIHIRTVHPDPHVTPAQREKIRSVNAEIRDTLLYLRRHYGIQEVYCEGVTPGLEDLLGRQNCLGQILQDSDDYAQVSEVLGDLATLAHRGIVVKAASTLLGEMLAEQEVDRGGSVGLATLDNREDIALNLLADDGLRQPRTSEQVFVVLYGGIHSFGGPASCGSQYSNTGRGSYKDNIASWNKWHKNKYSLIEITPLSYHRMFTDED